MAQWAVRLTEATFTYRELTVVLEAASLAEARNRILTRLNDLAGPEANLVTLRQYTPEDDWSEIGDPEPIEIVSIVPWPPDTSAPARHLESPSRLDR